MRVRTAFEQLLRPDSTLQRPHSQDRENSISQPEQRLDDACTREAEGPASICAGRHRRRLSAVVHRRRHSEERRYRLPPSTRPAHSRRTPTHGYNTSSESITAAKVLIDVSPQRHCLAAGRSMTQERYRQCQVLQVLCQTLHLSTKWSQQQRKTPYESEATKKSRERLWLNEKEEKATDSNKRALASSQGKR